MKLGEYFENNKGIGVLSTTDSNGNGNVNMTIYGRPKREQPPPWGERLLPHSWKITSLLRASWPFCQGVRW